ncbi:alpha-D-ribose 1-methylphosphonate 5-triphosphate synthase subunit PhnG [Ensifer sp. SEMIA 135]|uniref:phosphonate C-P lyase system protein PhnG n=1 Tax=Rhizobium meliloti TaxID=382 RepID=UPI000FD9D9BC|nr:phosphonate C-P lyase system protein PhnG [Sinorhizobium meliloti]RVL21103.1 phosphonate C-P lyase system protein PhnG [Sinorhizobium meliloti]RVP94613.1 phosphonate C-P lyase system protein PhnG [Sinorhizobium meliloti]TWA88502.1 alpha-D-ribose 1-methylphosphonate 5-triphosphate synthase subunit PhnG [Ensifer sp. SEMIA 134]TWB24036.1 alpha-D-ribose 1-methylphosphonate 5-triphosphate synthase subunit PhnG [Ensifer sp. SEMIA 135]
MAHEKTGDPLIGTYYDHGQTLAILAASRPDIIKACAEAVLEGLGDVTVISNRTGLAMLPFTDTVQNTAFHVGEVLIAEAHIRVVGHGVEGYGAVVGRDLEQAMAMAVIDAAVAGGHRTGQILEFLNAERCHQEETDRQRLKKVEATRVQMETF